MGSRHTTAACPLNAATLSGVRPWTSLGTTELPPRSSACTWLELGLGLGSGSGSGLGLGLADSSPKPAAVRAPTPRGHCTLLDGARSLLWVGLGSEPELGLGLGLE
eukprot:scaffold25088_cov72-Phaeocystis_antarctica.AAC.6